MPSGSILPELAEPADSGAGRPAALKAAAITALGSAACLTQGASSSSEAVRHQPPRGSGQEPLSDLPPGRYDRVWLVVPEALAHTSDPRSGRCELSTKHPLPEKTVRQRHNHPRLSWQAARRAPCRRCCRLQAAMSPFASFQTRRVCRPIRSSPEERSGQLLHIEPLPDDVIRVRRPHNGVSRAMPYRYLRPGPAMASRLRAHGHPARATTARAR